MKLTDNAPTPKWLFEQFSTRGYFDPCPSVAAFNGLDIEWPEKNFVNPPFSNKIPWIYKAILEGEEGKTVILFLPVDTSAAWFHDLIMPFFQVFLFRGRINLDNGHHPKFPNMLCRIN